MIQMSQEGKTILKTMGERIREVRRSLGFKQSELAKEIGSDISPIILSRIENGMNVGSDKLLPVLMFLSEKVNINYLLSGRYDITNRDALFHMNFEFNSMAKAKLDLLKEDLDNFKYEIDNIQELL